MLSVHQNSTAQQREIASQQLEQGSTQLQSQRKQQEREENLRAMYQQHTQQHGDSRGLVRDDKNDRPGAFIPPDFNGKGIINLE